jgi:homoserine kinase
VPATSANLGPGFDSFGLALGLHDEVSCTVSRTDEVEIEIDGEGVATLSRGPDHLVVRSLRECLGRMGVRLPGLRMHCRNRIPHGRGLGSSSAAIVAGVVVARALLADGEKRLDDLAMLDLAAGIEGHPDNVAACLFGGFTIAWTEPNGARVVSLRPAPDVVPVLFVPESQLETERARGLLPATVPHADAAANSARAALLVHALTVDPALLLSATEDRLHQEYRRVAMPASLELMDRLRNAGIPATVSGAGPTVLALAGSATAQVAVACAPAAWRVELPGVAQRGATVRFDPPGPGQV